VLGIIVPNDKNVSTGREKQLSWIVHEEHVAGISESRKKDRKVLCVLFLAKEGAGDNFAAVADDVQRLNGIHRRFSSS
jgi:hypothetical protein